MKKLPEQAITGQRGVNLIERIVLSLGFVWHATGALEAGIDGTIELRDPATGSMIGGFIFVQSKATRGAFQAETPETFEYLCSEQDLAYWLSGTAPVILIRSRPDTEEAYWISVKGYFSDPARRQTRKIVFDKRQNRLDGTVRNELLSIAVPPDSGAYFTPPPRAELLYSNLLAVESLPEKLFIAETDLRGGRAIVEQLAEAQAADHLEWVLKNRRILSVRDLSRPPWVTFCDQGTVEEFSTSEWAEAEDMERRRDFVQLLNECLRAKLRRLGVVYHRDLELYYFRRTHGLSPRRISYRSLAKKSKRVVFQGYQGKLEPGEVAYFRHSAFEGRFRSFNDKWFLQIVPSYFFSRDGVSLHPFYESRLKGIKALERNPAVLGQIVMWADLLAEHRRDLFTPQYPYLRFSSLVALEAATGIDDSAWLKSEEDETLRAAGQEPPELPLFSNRLP